MKPRVQESKNIAFREFQSIDFTVSILKWSCNVLPAMCDNNAKLWKETGLWKSDLKMFPPFALRQPVFLSDLDNSILGCRNSTQL